MGQNIESSNKSTFMISWFLTNVPQICQGGERQTFKTSSGEAKYGYAKEYSWVFSSYLIWKVIKNVTIQLTEWKGNLWNKNIFKIYYVYMYAYIIAKIHKELNWKARKESDYTACKGPSAAAPESIQRLQKVGQTRALNTHWPILARTMDSSHSLVLVLEINLRF